MTETLFRDDAYLRSSPATIVAVTGYGQPEDRRATKAAGFDHHLVKPVGLQQLEQLIEAATPVGAAG